MTEHRRDGRRLERIRREFWRKQAMHPIERRIRLTATSRDICCLLDEVDRLTAQVVQLKAVMTEEHR